jgi:hypothetical protein
MKLENTAVSVVRLVAGLLLVGATGCVAAGPDDTDDESVEQRDDAFVKRTEAEGDPCAGQPDSPNYGYPYYIVGYGCVEQGYHWGYELKYCRDGQTQLLNCTNIGRTCMDYADYGPGYGAYCEDLGY